MKMKTHVVTGEDIAAYVALALVRASASFSLMPYPDNQWKFTFKPEVHGVVLLASRRPSNPGGES